MTDQVWPPVFKTPTNRFVWPSYARSPGVVSYGNLTPEQVAALSPVMQSKLTNPNNVTLPSVVDSSNPELQTFSDVVLPTEPTVGPKSAHTYEPLRYGNFNHIALSQGAADSIVLPQPSSDARRIFLFILNTHPVQTMNVAFGIASTATLGILIAANNGFIAFDTVVPQDDVHLIGSGAATTGVLVFANKKPDQPGE